MRIKTAKERTFLVASGHSRAKSSKMGPLENVQCSTKCAENNVVFLTKIVDMMTGLVYCVQNEIKINKKQLSMNINGSANVVRRDDSDRDIVNKRALLKEAYDEANIAQFVHLCQNIRNF